MTAYFVDPSTICSVGRSAEDVEDEGPGYLLAFQNGETEDSLHYAPMTRDEADDEVKVQA